MEKLLRDKKIKALALIASAVLGALAFFGIALFSLKLLYLPLAICIVIAISSIYAVLFLSFSLRDAKLYEKIISKAEEGITSIDELSNALGIKPEALEKIINKCKKNGYITADKTAA